MVRGAAAYFARTDANGFLRGFDDSPALLDEARDAPRSWAPAARTLIFFAMPRGALRRRRMRTCPVEAR